MQTAFKYCQKMHFGDFSPENLSLKKLCAYQWFETVFMNNRARNIIVECAE